MRVHEMTMPQDLQPSHLQLIAQKASQFRSDIKIKFEKENIQVDAKSLLGMMLLPLRQGTKIIVQTKGNDEEEAIDLMCEMLENRSL